MMMMMMMKHNGILDHEAIILHNAHRAALNDAIARKRCLNDTEGRLCVATGTAEAEAAYNSGRQAMMVGGM